MILAFVIGLVFGSFLNVVVYRLKSGGSIGLSRSFCPYCKTTLKWYDLIPLLSFIYLRGRCRYCDERISWQYPAVEILSGLIWVGVFYKVFSFQPLLFLPLDKGGLWGVFNFFYYIFIFSTLLVIAVYDFKWRIIPDKIVYPTIAVALIFIAPLDKGGMGGFFNIYGYFLTHLLTASLAFLFFFSIFYFSKGRAMGLGDAKLAFLVGLFLSPLLAIVAFLSAFIIGAVFGIILIGFGKKTLKSQIAFGPFLVLGATIAFFASNFIINFFQP